MFIRGGQAGSGKLWMLLVLAEFFLATLRAEPVRVATYNLNNYLSLGRMVEGRYKPEYPKPESEKAALRAVIREANPDVLAVQEVGGPYHLEELQADLAAEGLHLPYAALMRGPDTLRHTAILSRVPFEAVHSHDFLDFPYFGEREAVKRGLLEAVFVHDEMRWSVFVVHLKSRWQEHDQDPASVQRRTKEARAIRNFIRERYPPILEPKYIITGDFNDHKRSATLRRFLKVNDIELNKMLPAADSRGERWTFHYRYEDRYERVDYILVSPALYPRVKGRRGTIVDTLPMAHVASDHRLVYCDLRLPPRNPAQTMKEVVAQP